MKKTTILLLSFMALTFNAISQDCTNCTNTVTGTNASAIGENSSATGFASFASGYEVYSEGDFAFGQGKYLNIDGGNSLAIGRYLETTTIMAMVIGSGAYNANRLTNSISNSLMIGFGSDKPTLFVKGAFGTGYTGRIGIGDVTDPQAKLHIKADEGEQATLFIEPYFFSGGESVKLRLGTMDYGIAAGYGRLYFNTGGNYIFNSTDANVGIGVSVPNAKLQVNGNIFIDNGNSGLILKSQDGQCWKGTISNSGEFAFESIDCSLTTNTDDSQIKATHSIQIYPNPAKNKIQIRSVSDVILYAGILAMNGTLLLTKELVDDETEISLENFSPGYYLIRITDRDNKVITTEKIFKE